MMASHASLSAATDTARFSLNLPGGQRVGDAAMSKANLMDKKRYITDFSILTVFGTLRTEKKTGHVQCLNVHI